jgi:hypothetical protein
VSMKWVLPELVVFGVRPEIVVRLTCNLLAMWPLKNSI